MARQTFGGVSGISRWDMPNGFKASQTAATTAGGAPTQPASPMPLTPSGSTAPARHESPCACGEPARCAGNHNRAATPTAIARLVVLGLFEQGLSDPLRNPAVHLPVAKHGIDHHAHIIHCHIVKNRHCAGLRIDFHNHGMAAVRRAQGDRLIEDALIQPCFEIPGQLVRKVCHSCYLGEGDNGRVRGAGELAIHILDFLLGDFEHDRGDPAAFATILPAAT